MTFRSAHALAWDAPAPDALANVPNQLGAECRAAYFHAAKNFFSPDGAIVDGGTLAGGSSRALLEGCRASGQPLTNRFFYAFDVFRCDKYTSGFFTRNFPGEWPPGKSFRPVYEQAISEYREYVNIIEGDINEFRAWTGPPIDVLGVDIWKTESIAEHFIRVFFPHLRVGSIVLQQDYNHGFLPYIHSLMELFCGHFEKIHETRQWGTVVFQTVRTPTPKDIDEALKNHGYYEERRQAAETAFRRARLPHTALWIQIADCVRKAQFEGLPEALAALERAKGEGAKFEDKFRRVFAQEIEKIEMQLRSGYSAE